VFKGEVTKGFSDELAGRKAALEEMDEDEVVFASFCDFSYEIRP